MYTLLFIPINSYTFIAKVFTIKQTVCDFFVIFLVPSVGCQKTSNVPSVNCTNNNNTQSLYAEINTALWSKKMRPVTHPSEVLTVKLGLSVAGILGVVSTLYISFHYTMLRHYMTRMM